MKLKYEAVVIGTSAGAVESLCAILPNLPKDYPLPLIVVVHLPQDKKSVMVELLRDKCQLKVSEVDDKEDIERSHIYIAPPDYHLLIESDKTLALTYDEPEMFSRPSIDVLFESAAEVFRNNLLGIVLSGANSDGAKGAKKIAEENGHVIVQDPSSAYANTMPSAAKDACPSALIMNLKEISTYLQKGIYL